MNFRKRYVGVTLGLILGTGFAWTKDWRAEFQNSLVENAEVPSELVDDRVSKTRENEVAEIMIDEIPGGILTLQSDKLSFASDGTCTVRRNLKFQVPGVRQLKAGEEVSLKFDRKITGFVWYAAGSREFVRYGKEFDRVEGSLCPALWPVAVR